MYLNMEQIVLVGGARGALMHSGVCCWKSIHANLDFIKCLVDFEVRNGPRYCFGKISGAGNILLEFNFQIFLGWLL